MKRLTPVLALPLLLVACGGADAPSSVVLEGGTMGTSYRVRVDDASALGRADELAGVVEDVLERVNRATSTFLPGSEVSRFNASRGPEPFEFTPETFEVLATAVRLSRDTGGAFDPTVSPLVDAWGFGPSGAVATAPSAARVAELRERIGWAKLQLDPEALTARKLHPELEIDLGAVAKGFAVDAVSEALAQQGLTDFLVEVGGEVRTRGRNGEGIAWRIGIERPETGGSGHVERVVGLTDRAMATSGNYRNFYLLEGERVAHTIDPRTGWPVEHPGASVTVIADTCMEADGLATAMMVMGPEMGVAWAQERGIAVLYLVWNGERFVDRATPAFDEIRTATQAELGLP